MVLKGWDCFKFRGILSAQFAAKMCVKPYASKIAVFKARQKQTIDTSSRFYFKMFIKYLVDNIFVTE